LKLKTNYALENLLYQKTITNTSTTLYLYFNYSDAMLKGAKTLIFIVYGKRNNIVIDSE